MDKREIINILEKIIPPSQIRNINIFGTEIIIDLNIEGISLIIAQREEFQSFLANNNYDLDKLIEKIISVSN